MEKVDDSKSTSHSFCSNVVWRRWMTEKLCVFKNVGSRVHDSTLRQNTQFVLLFFFSLCLEATCKIHYSRRSRSNSFSVPKKIQSPDFMCGGRKIHISVVWVSNQNCTMNLLLNQMRVFKGCQTQFVIWIWSWTSKKAATVTMRRNISCCHVQWPLPQLVLNSWLELLMALHCPLLARTGRHRFDMKLFGFRFLDVFFSLLGNYLRKKKICIIVMWRVTHSIKGKLIPRCIYI